MSNQIKKLNMAYFYSTPLLAWLVAFFVLPMLIVMVYAFLTKGTYGGVKYIFTQENFSVFSEPVFYSILWRTVYLSVIITFLTILLGVPTAYYIARSDYKKELLFLIIIPFWTNFLIRIYAWMAILGNNGLINILLEKLGISPVQFLYNSWAIIVVSVYTSLPFAILPLYAVIEKFDFSLIEAARDLGATNFQAFRKVFIPNILPGIGTAMIFTFIPNLGSYAVPKLVGGTNSMMLGTLIAQHLIETRNWPMASAISLILILVIAFIILFFSKNLLAKEGGK
ncbi:MAG: ABC transporter permease [Fusobacteriaceae bacterium]